MRFESKSLNMIEDRDSELSGSHAFVYCSFLDGLTSLYVQSMHVLPEANK